MVIQIDSAGLSAIYAASQSVTLVRSVQVVVETWAASEARVAAAPAGVAWQAFQPLASNTVEWDDEYCAFATTTPLGPGAVLAINAQSPPMQLGLAEVFRNGGFTTQPQGGSAHVVANASSSGSYAFGLMQSATINDVSALAPISAVPVLYNQAAFVSPADVISIFLSSATTGGTVLPVPSNAFSVAASAGATGPTIGFNDRTNMFFQLA